MKKSHAFGKRKIKEIMVGKCKLVPPVWKMYATVSRILVLEHMIERF
jgi:hypothetical protein